MDKKRFPARRFYGDLSQTSMAGLESMRDISNRDRDEAGYTGERVMGFKLPVWQRDPAWSEEQCAAFIESIWLGVSLGTFMLNYSASGKDDETHMVLVDGQQRLRAIESYWAGKFGIQGDDGKVWLWTDLTDAERAHFYRIPFPWICTHYATDAELREASNRHNYGGTPHRPDERA